MKSDADLFVAIAAGDLHQTARLIEEDPSRLFSRDANGHSPVVSALAFGHPELARYLARRMLGAIRRGIVRDEDLYSSIHALGEAQLTEAEGDIIRFLGHADPEVRYIAVSVLTFHWDRPSCHERLEEIIGSDPSEDVRAVGARGLGYLMRGTKDKGVSALFLRKLRDSNEDGYVREAAYDGLREVWLAPADREHEVLRDIRDTAKRTLDRDAYVEKVRRRSPEEFEAYMTLREMEWLGKVDWGFVEMVEREVSG